MDHYDTGLISIYTKKVYFGSRFKYVDCWDLSNQNLNQVPPQLINYLNDFEILDNPEFVVEYIDLSFNKISKIPEDLKLSKIIGLDLSHNKISLIPDSIDYSSLEYLDLSNNFIDQITPGLVLTSHNLVLLKLNDNSINALKLTLIKKLLEIEFVFIENSISNFNFTDKVSAAIRMGIVDRDEILKSRFKFREVNAHEIVGGLSTLDGPRDDRYRKNKDKYYLKYYEILSTRRFDYYNGIGDINNLDGNFYPNDGRHFWRTFREKMKIFGDLVLMSSKFDNFIILCLTNNKRVDDFLNFIPQLFLFNILISSD